MDNVKKIYNDYDSYIERSIVSKWIRHSELQEIIAKFKSESIYEISSLGFSVEGREINLIKIGSGSINILAWSQMHGNESTATMALCDLLNFFSVSDIHDEVRHRISENISLYIIPMLNPDGAEVFQRENAFGIDLNRDALNLTSPESVILKNIVDKINPVFSLNLHDQNIHYAAGGKDNPASISFLATAYNFEKEINTIRANAMKLVAELYKQLQNYIPNKMGKYSDDFEPRAFGDNIAKWGSGTVLIETGGYVDDPDKQFLRKINFITYLHALLSIAEESFQVNSIQDYYNIPDNDEILFDLMLRDACLTVNDKKYYVDIGINLNELPDIDNKKFNYLGTIAAIGDLSTHSAYKIIECKKKDVSAGSILEIKNTDGLDNLLVDDYLKNGITTLIVDQLEEEHKKFPINFSINKEYSERISIEYFANLVIRNSDTIEYVIANGMVYNILENKNEIINGIIIK